MIDRDLNLLDFEDQIRIDAVPLNEGMEELINNGNETYVVGAGIRVYIDTLRDLGFKDIWQAQIEDIDKLTYHINKFPDQKNNGMQNLMYAYIDYVLDKPRGEVAVFLPQRSGLLALGPFGGPTNDEIVRILEKFSNNYDRIHFVTGLYEHTPESFALQGKVFLTKLLPNFSSALSHKH